MAILLVANNPSRWALAAPGVEVVAARDYLTVPAYSEMRPARVVNVCRSYAYQSMGYYVSLLAEARGHRPQPDATTIQDMKSSSLARVITDDLDELVQKTLRPIRGDAFTLSIYFGKTTAQRDRRLGARLFGLFRCPLLRAQFARKNGRWVVRSLRPIPSSEVPDAHWDTVLDAASGYFARREWSAGASKPPRDYLAILHDPDEEMPPSGPVALRKFVRAAHRAQLGTELITRDDYGQLGAFDALLIRTTTAINHYTYRFARKAAAEGLAVIDDPVSIARCTNKVYLAERMSLHGVPTPKTVIVHRDNAHTIAEQLGLPVVLKQPDSAFSVGVKKASTAEELGALVEALLEKSELIIAQAYMPTGFDWRVGVLDGRALYVCKYFMAKKHWQIQQRSAQGKMVYGNHETMPVEDAPRRIVQTAVKAARLIGDGLYGVDVKEIDGKPYVMEVNDNPNIDAGVEDMVLKDKLYDAVIASLVARMQRLRTTSQPRPRKGSDHV